MKKIDIAFGALKVPLDFAAGTTGLLAAYHIRQFTDLIPGAQFTSTYVPELEGYMQFAVLAGIGLVIMHFLNGYYSFDRRVSLRKELGSMIYGTFLWMMLIIGYFFLMREFFYSRLVLFYGAIFTLLFLWGGRILLRASKQALLRKGLGKNRLVFVGNSDTAQRLAAFFSKERSHEILGCIDDKAHGTLGQHIPRNQDLHEALEHLHVDEVIQTKFHNDEDYTNLLVSYCREHHIRYRMVPDVLELQMTNVDVEWQDGLPIIELKPTALDGWGRISKRVFDVAGAILGILILSPVILITALAVALQMKSPKEVIFRQKRYGYKGRLFWFYKFQSMRKNAEAEHAKLMEQSERKGFLKLKKDPRVTKVGRIIRKTSLDELPQLWNVIRGDMSLVGPRPHMPTEIDQVSKSYQRVLSVKPGITGLAQISGRSSLDFEDEMKLDLAYIERWSLWMDITIILKTIIKICKRENAS